MPKRPPECAICGEKMTLIEGTEHSYICGSCGAKNISSLDKKYMEEYMEQRKRTISEFVPKR